MDKAKTENPSAATDGPSTPSTQHSLVKENVMGNNNGSIDASMIIIAETKRFLDCLGQGEQQFTFQTIPVNPRQSMRMPRVLHGTFEQHVETLTSANLNGDGIFVAINQTNGEGRKATDIVQVRALFVDLDNVPLSAFDSAEVPANIIVESSPGKGHGYWLINDCSLGDFSIMQKALARRFGGDPAVCDLPRVMRLPGFIHTKGAPFTCKIININSSQPYSMASLSAMIDEGQATLNTSKALPNLTGTYVASMNRSYGDGERTQALVYLAGKLIAEGHDDDEVFKKLGEWNDRNTPPLDPAIVSRTIASLRRTHSRNHPDKDDIIKAMNAKYAVVLLGSKSVVIYEHGDDVKFLPPADFDNQLANQRLPDGKPVAKYWRTHKDRRTYQGVTFDPSGKASPDLYNQWSGFAVQPEKGSCRLFLNHVREVICDNKEPLYEYIIDWMADIVQNPAKLLGVALVLMGGQGRGKGIFAEYFGRIFGQHFQRVSNPEHLVGRFSGNLSKTLLVYSDEAFCSRDKSKIGALKTLITEARRTVESKFKDALEVSNFVRLIMASNEDWVVPAEFDERRFCVLEVSGTRKGDDAYFKAILKERDSGGTEALIDYLLQRNLSDKNLRAFPVTGALIGQKLKNLRSHELWLYDVLQIGEIHGKPVNESIVKSSLYGHYTEHCQKIKRRYVEDISTFFKTLYDILPSIIQSRPRKDGHQERHIQLPPLAEAREAFEKWIGGKVPWIE